MTVLPDEIQSAGSTLGESFRAAAPDRGMRRRYAFFYLALFAVGAWIFAGLVRFDILSVSSTDFWRSTVSVLAVLSGFMITTMLFTGKAEAAKSLTLEQLRGFTEKSNHLLVSQFCTLASHLGGLLTIGVISACKPDQFFARSLVVLVGGFLLTSAFRSVLIPLQIIELHRFAHAALLREKAKEASDAAAKLAGN